MNPFRRLLLTVFAIMAVVTISLAGEKKHGEFTIGNKTFLLNGKPFVIKAAEIHYPRIPRPYWEHRIKMCKALGMNTICIYVFWNIHEQKEGVFNFSGNNDIAAFCRLAQKNGMYVIVRPGPYVCAEWEMGGLPWWLLKKKDIRLREQDPYFMKCVDRFEKQVAGQLAPLTIQHGGPIIMVQVENEYGSYGEDKAYVSDVRDCLRKLYGDVTLFQCDWASNFEKNGLNDLVWTMNFGTGADINSQFKRLKQLRPTTPLMCSEFWSGWFDKWGARHETRPAEDMVEGIDKMLSEGISFSLYMTHGGTSFGHWAGANSPGFAPDVTSYDYDAPINEYGLATPKFWQLRKTMEKYSDGRKLPDVPKTPMPIIRIPQLKLTEFTSLNNAAGELTDATNNDLTFENANLGWGSMIYYNTLPDIPVASSLSLNDVHDYGQVFINGKYIGKVDRVKNEKSIMIPAVKKGDRIVILVEAMGRINFGKAIKDYKGITKDVTLSADIDGNNVTWTLGNWKMQSVKDDYNTTVNAFNKSNDNYTEFGKRGYYRGYFYLKKTGDTFIDMEKWGKGQVWINGHAIGRFWSIGPQQTLYMPGCWLKKGRNEIIVQDVAGPKEPVVWGQDKPELDKLQLEKSNKHNNIGDKPDLNSATPIKEGHTESTEGWQTITFDGNAKGRYVAIECKSTYNGDACAIAELYLKDANGKRLGRDNWSVKYADSENENGNHTGDKAFDLQESTYWQTEKGSAFPHLIVIDLGTEKTISAMDYLPRTEQGTPGKIKDYRIFIY